MANAGSALTRRRTLRPEAAREIRLTDPQVAAIRATVEMARHPSEVVELKIEAPQYGVYLKDGRLRARLQDDELTIADLSFSAGEGRFVASGTMPS